MPGLSLADLYIGWGHQLDEGQVCVSWRNKVRSPQRESGGSGEPVRCVLNQARELRQVTPLSES